MPELLGLTGQLPLGQMSNIDRMSLLSSPGQWTLRTSQSVTVRRSMVEIMMMTLSMMMTSTSHQSRHEHLNLLDPTTVRLVVPALLC